MRHKVGIDVGGTFTDAVSMNTTSGEIRYTKTPSTPENPADGVVTVLRKIMSIATIQPSEIEYLIYGTTIATNTVIERKGARTGLIATEGFRDSLEIRRAARGEHLYDLLTYERPKPLVPRYLRLGVPERINYKGEILKPLDEEAVRKAVREMKRLGVESVAVSLLHSYANPTHEKRIKEIIREELPDVPLSISSEICPLFREYERTSTTVVNAHVMPIFKRHVDELSKRLEGIGVKSEFYIMQSNGGVMPAQDAAERVAYVIESGPAAGALAGAFLGKMAGFDGIITFDMGGTTAKCGLAKKGELVIKSHYEVGLEVGKGRLVTGTGYPLYIPAIDLAEVGAGGGSIAWVDKGGVFQVGPVSAGAYPGPVCYGLGGMQVTVTDANVVLGRIDPDYFLGGEMKIDVKRAIDATRKLGDQLGLDMHDTARGIIDLVNLNMARALRGVSIERGYDPRDFAMIAFGGAGPMHAAALAAELKVPYVLVPPWPGVTSAIGLLVTDIRYDFRATHKTRLADADIEKIVNQFEKLEDQGLRLLLKAGISKDNMSILRSLDMRFVGQSEELNVPVPPNELKAGNLEQINSRFHEIHRAEYGFALPDFPTEIVNLRLTATGAVQKPEFRRQRLAGEDPPEGAVYKMAEVFYGEAGGFIKTPFYKRDKLLPGNVVEGPAIIEQVDSTAVISPGHVAKVDEYTNIIIKTR